MHHCASSSGYGAHVLSQPTRTAVAINNAGLTVEECQLRLRPDEWLTVLRLHRRRVVVPILSLPLRHLSHDLIMGDKVARLGLSETLLNIVDEHEAIDRIKDRCIVRKCFKRPDHALLVGDRSHSAGGRTACGNAHPSPCRQG